MGFKRLESVANFYKSHRNLDFSFSEKSDLAIDTLHFHVATASLLHSPFPAWLLQPLSVRPMGLHF